MRDKSEEKLSVLRMLASALKNKQIALRTGTEVELAEEQIMEVIASEVKKRQDSVEVYRQGNREDLAAKEEREIEILKIYLPAQISDEEIEAAVTEIVKAETDFGKAMGQAMAKLKGQADGKRVGAAVKKLLAK